MNLPPIPPENGNSIPHKAAKASLLAVGLAIGIPAILRNNLISDVIASALILGGFIAAIIGLAGIPTYGKRGLLGPGIAGLLINGLLIVIFVFNFSKAYQRAHASHATRQNVEPPANDVRLESTTNFDAKADMTNASFEKLDEVRERMKNLSQNSSGADAIMADAIAANAERTQIAVTNYRIAGAKLRAAQVLAQFDPADKGQFAARRALVEQFLEANAALKQSALESEDRMRLDLAKAHIPSSEIKRRMAFYHNGTAATYALTLQSRQCDERIGAALLDALNTLETNWGKWKLDPHTGKILFEDTATRDAYNNDIVAIKAAVQEQQKLKAKVVNQ